jgi:non-ribosomal peptide synthetase component F
MTLPFRRAVRLSKVDPASGNIRWRLASEISQRLSGLGRQAGATAYLVWLAALSTQLAAEMNQSDIVIGTYVSNRTRFEMENMLGLFANLAAVRFRCDLDKTFQRWLIVVRDTIAGVRKRSAIPYEQLRMELHRRGVVMPDIQVIFNLSQPQLPMRFAGLEVTSIDRTNDSMPWGFSVNLEESSEGQFCSITFDANCYDPADVQGFSNRFRQLLESITQHPDVPLCELTASSIAQPGYVN